MKIILCKTSFYFILFVLLLTTEWHFKNIWSYFWILFKMKKHNAFRHEFLFSLNQKNLFIIFLSFQKYSHVNLSHSMSNLSSLMLVLTFFFFPTFIWGLFRINRFLITVHFLNVCCSLLIYLKHGNALL